MGSPLYRIDTSAQAIPVNAEATLGNTAPSVNTTTTTAKLPIISVPVPIMGESITSGMLASWDVKSGDFVKADQVVAVIETDKVSVR